MKILSLFFKSHIEKSSPKYYFQRLKANWSAVVKAKELPNSGLKHINPRNIDHIRMLLELLPDEHENEKIDHCIRLLHKMGGSILANEAKYVTTRRDDVTCEQEIKNHFRRAFEHKSGKEKNSNLFKYCKNIFSSIFSLIGNSKDDNHNDDGYAPKTMVSV